MNNLIKTTQLFLNVLWKDHDHQSIESFFSEKTRIISSLNSGDCPKVAIENVSQWVGSFSNQVIEREFFCDQQASIVITRWSTQAKHIGEFFGFRPTGGIVHYSGINLYKFYDNKISSYESIVNLQQILNQLENLTKIEPVTNLIINDIKLVIYNKFKASLSRKEIIILSFWVEGYSAKEIAQYLNISYRTVEIYIYSVYTKLEMRYKNIIKRVMYQLDLGIKLKTISDYYLNTVS